MTWEDEAKREAEGCAAEIKEAAERASLAATLARFILATLLAYAKLPDPVASGSSLSVVYNGGFDLWDGSEVVFFAADLAGLRWVRTVLWQNGTAVASATLPAPVAREMWAKCRELAKDDGHNELAP